MVLLAAEGQVSWGSSGCLLVNPPIEADASSRAAAGIEAEVRAALDGPLRGARVARFGKQEWRALGARAARFEGTVWRAGQEVLATPDERAAGATRRIKHAYFVALQAVFRYRVR
jgi:hypothetical protein